MVNPPLLAGTRALVTGASRGIGLATSLRMARAGATVAMLSRRAPDVPEPEVVAPGRLVPIGADVSDPASVQHACETAVEDLGGIDVVVNNAGAPGPRGALWQVDPAEAVDAFLVNTMGPLHVLRCTLPDMVRRGAGVVINVSSGQAVRPKPGSAVYGASKAALDHLTDTLVLELAGSGVRVHGIYPGPVDTELNSAHAGPDRDRSRLRPPEEPAALITWLASEHGVLADTVTIRWRDDEVKRALRALSGFPG
jgi:NAD(P)-dependent dehydrogenase (short-subunit alcohol dehydrogenase family)